MAYGRTARLERLRTGLDSFLEELERAEYEALAGLRDEPTLTRVFERYADIFEADNFDLVEPLGGDSGEDRRRLYLREFLAEAIEGNRTRELKDRLLAIEATATAEVDGRSIEYRRLPLEIRREPDRARRTRLDEARLQIVVERLNPLHRSSIEKHHAVAVQLLDTTYDRYCETLSGVDFELLATETERLLVETEDLHGDLLDYFARQRLPEVARDELQAHDLARILYGADFEPFFDGRQMVPRLSSMVQAMGIDPVAGGRIELDLEERPAKTPRAFCAPIRVPDEVKLVLRPYGGHDDYTTFLHELGHALHFAHVDSALPLEFRRLGDNGVTEGYAVTFDHLMLLAPFQRRVVGIADPTDFLRFAGFREMVMLRRYAAKFHYERSLHRKGPRTELAEEYADRLSRATGVRVAQSLFLDDVDPHFYCIRYLRAWMLSGILHEELRERYDEDWFVNPRTGEFLADLWSLGQAEPAEALATRIADTKLSFDPLLRMVHELV